MPFVSDPGDWGHVQEERAIEQAEFEEARYACRCPRCDRFGLMRGHDDHYGIIYHCSCLPVCWAVDPETGEKVEGVDVCKVHPDEEEEPWVLTPRLNRARHSFVPCRSPPN